MSSLPFKVKAVFEYNSGISEDLNFSNGQIINVTEEEDADWFIGEYTKPDGTKESGLFPKNFVERYEPETPPRPVRSKSKKDTVYIPAVETNSTVSPSEEDSNAILAKSTDSIRSNSTELLQNVTAPVKLETAPTPKPVIKSTSSGKAPPPTVADKPSSFKDRIAAFNKSSQAPLAPVNSRGQTSASGFIKKAFVAPPPSRDAYVPPPRVQAAQKIYRREEDPEIAERQAQDLADAEKAGLVQPDGAEEEEEAPKQSLKDRIAMLQKQQMEQAVRRAEVSAKDKLKKPAKKRTNSNDQAPRPSEADDSTVTRIVSAGSRSSMDMPVQATSPPLDIGTSRERLSTELQPREILSDENDADQSGAGDTTEDAEGNSTSVEDSDEKPKPAQIGQAPFVSEPRSIGDDGGANEEEEDEEGDEEDEIDAETRRKIELRERMAKMSGGMGMAGMFGGAMAMPTIAPKRKKQSSGASDYVQSTDGSGAASAPIPPQRLPAIPVTREGPPTFLSRGEPGLNDEREPSQSLAVDGYDDETGNDQDRERHPPATKISQDRGPPPGIPQERPLPQLPLAQRAVPPPPPTERAAPAIPQGRPVPPPPSTAQHMIDQGEPSDHETPVHSNKRLSAQPDSATEKDLPMRSGAPPVPGRSAAGSPQSPPFAEPSSPKPEIPASRPVPRIPIGSPLMSPQSELRPPPPPPPTAVSLSRKSTENAGPSTTPGVDEDGESDYEGDYDTDIASAAPPNHALRGHSRGVSVDDGSFSEATSASSPAQVPTSLPPPLPSSIQRPPPPPPPQQQPRIARQSSEIPRPPPPVPSTRDRESNADDDDYDPYRHTAPTHGIPSNRNTPVIPQDTSGLTGFVPVASSQRSADRTSILPQSPPPPPPAHSVPFVQMPRQSREIPRTSLDAPHSQVTNSRRSIEQPRVSTELGYIANDIDLGDTTQWWVQPNTPPPAIQNRNDVLFELEESSSSKRGGRTSISKDVYVLFMDYSQTIITARYDSRDVSDVLLEQRHEAPPARLRQDQLEQAHARFGAKISEAAIPKQNTTVGDGSANSLVLELLKSFSDALFPIGNRAYGALIYFNMANSTLNQYDEIRSGDIITFRNAKFQGKHGAMHQKYSLEVGKPDHVGIVVDWDGTKKKVRAFEQGREGVKKVKMESFRIGDLRSGEVKVWRIMSRSWVGWEGSNE